MSRGFEQNDNGEWVPFDDDRVYKSDKHVMNELYLILHKVRGEPTFDIATPLPIGEEEGWIIPTSGHRAYPWFSQPLHEIVQNDVMEVTELPRDWPDHFQVNSSPKEIRALGDSLLASLGLPTKVHSNVSGKLVRRI